MAQWYLKGKKNNLLMEKTRVWPLPGVQVEFSLSNLHQLLRELAISGSGFLYQRSALRKRPFFTSPERWEGPRMGNYQVGRRELSPAAEPGALDSTAFCRRGGGTFKDFCHFPKIAMGSVLPKVGEQVLEPGTPRSHHSSTTWRCGDFGELVNC